ncbi:hypothetical protein AMTRI_Chr06g191570 [Amborella trichopoda]
MVDSPVYLCPLFLSLSSVFVSFCFLSSVEPRHRSYGQWPILSLPKRITQHVLCLSSLYPQHSLHPWLHPNWIWKPLPQEEEYQTGMSPFRPPWLLPIIFWVSADLEVCWMVLFTGILAQSRGISRTWF